MYQTLFLWGIKIIESGAMSKLKSIFIDLGKDMCSLYRFYIKNRDHFLI
jgi:hypothetical protein